MDLLGKLAQGGCAADGTVAARNPLSQALDGVLRAGPMGRAQQHHPSEAPPGQYTQMDIHQAMADAALHHMRDQPPPFHHHDPRTATHAPPQVDMNHVWLQEKIQRDAAHRQMDNAFQHSSAASSSAPMMQQSQDHRVEFAPQQQYMHHHHGPPSSYIQQQVGNYVLLPVQLIFTTTLWQGLHHPPQMMPPPPPTFMQTQQLALEHQQHVAHVETVAKNDPSDTQRLSRDVASTMRQHGDARFHKSEFVQFMDALGSGRAELDDAGNTVVHHDSPSSELLADALDKDLTTLGGEDDAHDGGGLDVNALEQIWAKAMQEGQMLDPFQQNGWSIFNDGFDRAVEEDPYNLDALLALGVSNVNELKSHGALTTLQLWVQHNPKFHGLQVQLDDAYGDGSLMDEVMQLMLQAQAFDPQDSDVQDAAHCYLQALQQNDQADHIWSYLRIAFTCMERFDLVKLTDTKDVEAFRSEFQLVAL
ncbi:hypothetical protein DYB37_007551 [Aphanomyces astaci]|uniref:Uncharacterized protein n=1 Tax=Aphanomyces astaci TaxID=112090 RepID=A0A3R7B6M3_APHAT|nr:hypothetical protein DYB37_007551 [Aphanomyces astaci]